MWRFRHFTLVAGFLFAVPVLAADGPGDLIEHILQVAGSGRGVCTILGAADAGIALQLAGPEAFTVHVLDPDPQAVAAAITQADIDERYGFNLVVERMHLDQLPYATNLVDLVLSTRLTSKSLESLSMAEILRCLRPGGKALLGSRDSGALTPEVLRKWAEKTQAPKAEITTNTFGVWLQVTKPLLEGVDEWTHWEHSPDNNPVSSDQVIKAPYMTQFLGLPYYIAMPAITVAAGGRVFTAMGHIAHHKREEPWLNTLVACNGYNGTILWTKKLPDGYLVHRSAFIATADTFYMIDPAGEGCLMLDPETGAEKGRARTPRQRGEWKWMARQGDILYALVGREKDPPDTTLLRSDLSHWSWGGLSKGYYEKQIPWGFGNTVVAYDLKEGKLLWSHSEEGKIDSRAMAVGGGKVYFYGPDARLGCLDGVTGFLNWASADSEIQGLINEPGKGLTSTPGFRTACYSLYTPKALFFEGQTLQNVVAISTEDGRLLWHHPKTTSNPNMLYLEDKLIVGIGEDGGTLELEPLTGTTLADLGFRKRSCTRLTATPDSLFCRGYPEGFTRYDRETGEVLFNGAMRPACNDGAIGANGLLYTGPWMCDCNLSLMGRVVLCSAGDFKFDVTATDAARLEAGDSAIPEDKLLRAAETDWPYYRANPSHTGGSSAPIPKEANKVWEYQAGKGVELTAPIIAGGLVYLGGSDGKVRAISAKSGALKWVFRTAGPIPQAPCFWDGRVYAGSADGYAYCLEASTGRLIWRFRAAPHERRTMVYGSISSTWPVNTGVHVEEGVAYLGAGIIDYDGTYVYALDAKSGKLIWQNSSTGHLDPKLRKGVSAQGILTTALGRLWMAGGNVVSPAMYDLKTGEYLGDPPTDGSPQSNRGEEIGVLNSNFIFQGGRLRYSATENVVDPGRFIAWGIPKEAPNMTLCEGKIPPVWDDQRFVSVDGRKTPITCVTRKDLEDYLASWDPKKDAKVSWRATELGLADTVALALGRDGIVAVYETPPTNNLEPEWTICALDPADGSTVWCRDLPAEAVPSGLAVDGGGRSVVVLADGGVVCFGGPEAFEEYIQSLSDAARQDQGNPESIQRLRTALSEIHGSDTRKKLIDTLAELGVRVGKEAEERGCVARWKIIGPFPWDDENPADKAFIDVTQPAANQSCTVEGKVCEWQEYVSDDTDGMVDLENFFGALPEAAAFACAEINLPEDRELLLRTGSNDGLICWFNGVEVGRFEEGRSWNPRSDTWPIHGKAGKNVLVLKVLNMANRWSFSARLTDPSDAPVDLAKSEK